MRVLLNRLRPRTRSQSLLDVLAEYQEAIVVTHDNPDPDAIATGWAIHRLIEQKLAKPVRLIGGGGIVRAENRHMAELLEPPIQLVSAADIPEGAAAILVDCEAGGGNQLLTRQECDPVAVIDHHSQNGRPVPVRFRDVRPDVVACATIAGSYLREQRIEPGSRMATAMLFAMRTETRGEEFCYSSLDRSMLTWLTERAEPALLAEIESAPLNVEYFADLVLALQNAFIYGRSAICLLPRAEGTEIVGEMADLLIRCRGIARVLCAAMASQDLYVSVRTDSDHDNAVELVQATLAGIGSAGGHEHRAGGKITGGTWFEAHEGQWQAELRRRWLSACNETGKRAWRLVTRRDIMDHLQDTVQFPGRDHGPSS
jgi:nanoRNase/pAp phosphatase (c-di-AMP/oligoRNAs hydrolase)